MNKRKNIFKIGPKQIPQQVPDDNNLSCFLFTVYHLPFTGRAFTLAEVLITLGIIGVVAAMTIPVLMNYYQEQALLTQFNKAYSTISQAYVSAAQDNLTADHWTDQQTI